MKRKLLVLILASTALASCRREAAPAPKIQGDLIAPPPPVAAVAAAANDETTNPPGRHRHPKPPPTQVRMVRDAYILATDTNAWNGALPSGTKGSAADLARTNLPSVNNLPGLDVNLPGYDDVSFATLGGFDFVLTKEMADGGAATADIIARAEAQIPTAIRSLDGRKTVIKGFLLPVRMNDSLAVEFLLMRNQSMCCYGVAPKVNEWITVKLSGKGVEPIMDRPIAVAGVLHVGPIVENGCLAGIYSLDGEKVITTF